MLWMGACEAVIVASLGGLFGGFLMGYALKETNKFNMKAMETYWNADIRKLKSHIEALESKLSTISVVNSVNKQEKHHHNNGYKHKRPFKQGN